MSHLLSQAASVVTKRSGQAIDVATLDEVASLGVKSDKLVAMIDHVLAQRGMHGVGWSLTSEIGQKPDWLVIGGKNAHRLCAGGSHGFTRWYELQV